MTFPRTFTSFINTRNVILIGFICSCFIASFFPNVVVLLDSNTPTNSSCSSVSSLPSVHYDTIIEKLQTEFYSKYTLLEQEIHGLKGTMKILTENLEQTKTENLHHIELLTTNMKENANIMVQVVDNQEVLVNKVVSMITHNDKVIASVEFFQEMYGERLLQAENHFPAIYYILKELRYTVEKSRVEVSVLNRLRTVADSIQQTIEEQGRFIPDPIIVKEVCEKEIIHNVTYVTIPKVVAVSVPVPTPVPVPMPVPVSVPLPVPVPLPLPLNKTEVKQYIEELFVEYDPKFTPPECEPIIITEIVNVTQPMDTSAPAKLTHFTKRTIPSLDFALSSAGATVVASETSQTYFPHQNKMDKKFGDLKSLLPKTRLEQTIMETFGISYGVGGVYDALSADLTAGKCWAMEGSSGNFTIHLPSPINVTSVSIDHISKMESLDWSSAPGSFRVFGNNVLSERWRLLGSGYFEPGIDTVQNFELDNPNVFHYLKLEINSNHGHSDYTCLYRFRVHGDIPR